jgi:hypothetical protein
LVAGVSSEIYVWEGTLTAGTIPPYEGPNGISWRTTGLGWFGAGIMSIQPLNLFDFGDGDIRFMIKIPANVTFKIGIIDAWGNQSYVSFPAYQTKYGLVRNGQWGQASIPVADIRGLYMDLRMLSYAFVILEENGTACEFALDDIYWDAGIDTEVETAGSADRRRFELLSNAPNPFNALTEIRFDLPSGGPYEIVVFDASGRKVTGFRGIGNAGHNSLYWDGRDGSGIPVSSGAYFYRLECGEHRETKKMTLVK